MGGHKQNTLETSLNSYNVRIIGYAKPLLRVCGKFLFCNWEFVLGFFSAVEEGSSSSASMFTLCTRSKIGRRVPGAQRSDNFSSK